MRIKKETGGKENKNEGRLRKKREDGMKSIKEAEDKWREGKGDGGR